MMNSKRVYDIAFVGLKPGIHEFNYEISDKFFETFQQQDFTNCNANVKLLLDKKTNFMILKFEIGGTVQVDCDRCSNTLHLNLWDEFNVIVKMVEQPEQMNDQEIDPDVFYISHGESHINVENWIYEFINLSIPIQKTCGEDEAGKSLCNEAALKVLKNLTVKNEDLPKENPIWKDLDKFKNLEN